ncbi:MAG: AraC family transcriptional regulator [Planctomycetaceae bacterium]|nr:AraC family transcriptional regulator [Planctomycetales bacterium]MCB9936909.1 AraC family transcriptional regulator [Planctomycetaceae bacterium]
MATTPSTSRVADRSALRKDFFARIGERQQFQELFEHLAGVYFFVKDDQSRMMGASRSILERFGLGSEEEIIGTTDYDYFPPHIADSFVRDDRLVLETGKPMTGRVEIWYTAQRLLDWFVTNKLPVRASDGAIIGVMGTVQSYEGNRRSLLTYTQIDQVVEHIRTNHRGKITVTELARQANISPRQLHRKFIEVFRMSVQEFLTKTRIQGASDDLLNTDRSITEIAHDFGFCDQSAFTQQFKKHVGKTPLKFRRQHQV